MADIEMTTKTDTSFPAGALLFGADSTAATAPSLYNPLLVMNALGFGLTSMSPSSSGAANGAALTADAAAANGAAILVPPGDYELDETATWGSGTSMGVKLSALDVNIVCMPGVTFKPAAGFNGIRTVLLWCGNSANEIGTTGGCNLRIWNAKFDGLNQVSAGVNCNAGTLDLIDCEFTNFGDINLASDTYGTYGVKVFACSRVSIRGWKSYGNWYQKKNHTYSDQPGLVRHLYIQDSDSIHLQDMHVTGVHDGDDVDLLHFQDTRSPTNQLIRGTNIRLEYDGNCRRVLKVQGELECSWDGLTVVKSSNFTAVAPNNGISKVLAATSANPCVITTTVYSGSVETVFANGDLVTFAQMPGDFAVLNGTEQTVANFNSGTQQFELSGFNATGFTAYSAAVGTTAGQVQRVLPISAVTVGANAQITVTGHRKSVGRVLQISISGIVGTTELNGTTPRVRVVDANTLELIGVTTTNAYVSGGRILMVTDVGRENLNCIDWAGSGAGHMRITNSYIDATGYTTGVVTGLTTSGKITLENSTLKMGTNYVVRQSAESFAVNNNLTSAVLYITGSDECVLKNCKVIGSNRSIIAQGNRMIIESNIFDDPTDVAIQTGTTVKDGTIIRNNIIYTRTDRHLNVNSYAIRVDANTNVLVTGNRFVEAGNTNHTTTFISAPNANATGDIYDNVAPSGMTQLTYSAAPGIFTHKGLDFFTVATTSATVTTLATLTPGTNRLRQIEAQVLAKRTGGSAGAAGDIAGYTIRATVQDIAGVCEVIGQTAVHTAEDQAAWDCVFDASGTTIRLRVTGAANNDIQWSCWIRVY